MTDPHICAHRAATRGERVLLVLLALVPVLASAADDLHWAYPAPPPTSQPADNTVLKRVPGSARSYTQAQIDDPFAPPDWFPNEHPEMPTVVAQGHKPGVMACARCHLPSGSGHPESASLAGQSVPYLLRQLAEFKSGDRHGSVYATTMARIAGDLTEEEASAASQYFAAIEPTPWTTVIETATVPKTYVGDYAMRFADSDGAKEAIGNRIVVLPQDEDRARSRDSHSGFIDYVPPGSIARGKALVTTGGAGKTISCMSCHGEALKGRGDAPGIAGRPPVYLVRQLNDIRTGARSGAAIAPMTVVVAHLTTADIVSIAAYLGSQTP
jgi:cytochrome c553